MARCESELDSFESGIVRLKIGLDKRPKAVGVKEDIVNLKRKFKIVERCARKYY